MRLRDATLWDLPAIVEIYNATVPTRMVTADTQPVSVESRIPWFREHQPDRAPLWMIEDDAGALLGWLSHHAFNRRPAYFPTAELSVYVAEAHRRKGAARFALEAAIARAPALGLRTLIGQIFGHNLPSIRLFESFGFERWGHLPRVAELDGVERDVVIMGRRVDR